MERFKIKGNSEKHEVELVNDFGVDQITLMVDGKQLISIRDSSIYICKQNKDSLGLN